MNTEIHTDRSGLFCLRFNTLLDRTAWLYIQDRTHVSLEAIFDIQKPSSYFVLSSNCVSSRNVKHEHKLLGANGPEARFTAERCSYFCWRTMIQLDEQVLQKHKKLLELEKKQGHGELQGGRNRYNCISQLTSRSLFSRRKSQERP